MWGRTALGAAMVRFGFPRREDWAPALQRIHSCAWIVGDQSLSDPGEDLPAAAYSEDRETGEDDSQGGKQDLGYGKGRVGVVGRRNGGEDDGEGSAGETNDGERDGDGCSAGQRQACESAAAYQANESGEEQQVRDEQCDESHADQDVIGAADGGAGLSEDGGDDAGESVEHEGDPRGAEAGMDFAEDGGEITVDADNEGEARGGGEGGGRPGNCAEADQYGHERDKPRDAELTGELLDAAHEAVDA